MRDDAKTGGVLAGYPNWLTFGYDANTYGTLFSALVYMG